MFIRLLCVSVVVSALPGRKHASVATTLEVAHDELADIDAELDAELDAERSSSSGSSANAKLNGWTLDPSKMTCPDGWDDEDIDMFIKVGTKGKWRDHQSLVFELSTQKPVKHSECWLGELLGSAKRGLYTHIEERSDEFTLEELPLEEFTFDVTKLSEFEGKKYRTALKHGGMTAARARAGKHLCEAACSEYYEDDGTAAPAGKEKYRSAGKYSVWYNDESTCKCVHKVYECKSSLFEPLEGKVAFQTTPKIICAAFKAANEEWAKKKYNLFTHNCQHWQNDFKDEIIKLKK